MQMKDEILELVGVMYGCDPTTPITLQDLVEGLAGRKDADEIKQKVHTLIAEGKVNLVEGGIVL